MCVTVDIQEDLLKAEIYGKEMKDKFIKERFKTHINFFDLIKRSKLKTFENVDKRLWSRHQIKDLLSINSNET